MKNFTHMYETFWNTLFKHVVINNVYPGIYPTDRISIRATWRFELKIMPQMQTISISLICSLNFTSSEP